jgi:hypothetical protein
MDNIQYSADYKNIDIALKSLWHPCNELFNEMDNFLPRSLSDYEDKRKEIFEKLKAHNQDHSSLVEFVDSQIQILAEPKMQFIDRFYNRLMTQYITVIFLSHALCEAIINAILAIELTRCNSQEIFDVLEKASIEEKWCLIPKIFFPSYQFNRGTALYETFKHLRKERNGFVHYKIELSVEGKTVVEGSKLDRSNFENKIRWIKRFFNLPYDLNLHYCNQYDNNGLGSFTLVIGDRSPIKSEEIHNVSDPWSMKRRLEK